MPSERLKMGESGQPLWAFYLAAGILLCGCGVARNTWVGVRAGTTMLDTHITLYAANGDTIQTWHTRARVESQGGEAWWVDDRGVQHHIAGTFVVRGE